MYIPHRTLPCPSPPSPWVACPQVQAPTIQQVQETGSCSDVCVWTRDTLPNMKFLLYGRPNTFRYAGMGSVMNEMIFAMSVASAPPPSWAARTAMGHRPCRRRGAWGYPQTVPLEL